MASRLTRISRKRAPRRQQRVRPSTRTRSHRGVRHMSRWSDVPMGPKDPILGVTEAFHADTSPNKLNLGVGAYRDDNGKPQVLNSVRAAEQRIVDEKYNMEYAPIGGTADFLKHAQSLAFGEGNEILSSGRIASLQSLSGTGALRLSAAFLKKFGSDQSAVYLSNPTWGNHIPIHEHAQLPVTKYRYYNPETKGLDFNGMMDDIKSAPDNSIFVLHACAHNPTGVDPNQEQWREISALVKQKNHFPVIDMAYQGFASGDPVRDGFAVELFAEDGHQFGVCQSFAKNFGLYGQRVGALHLVTSAPEETTRVESQLKIIARAIYSSPPIQGARLVTTIMDDPSLKQQWYDDVKEMADRIIGMRQALYDELNHLGSAHNWDHIINQIGMFAYSGLNPEQVQRLTDEFHIYLTSNGRISMAGVTTKNVKYLAGAIHEVSK